MIQVNGEFQKTTIIPITAKTHNLLPPSPPYLARERRMMKAMLTGATMRRMGRLGLNPMYQLQAQAGFTSKVVTVTSGKGGVGKTTTAASFAYGLADEGYKTCVIDFDIGLR